MKLPPLRLVSEFLSFAGEKSGCKCLGDEAEPEQGDDGREDHDEVLFFPSFRQRSPAKEGGSRGKRTSVHRHPR